MSTHLGGNFFFDSERHEYRVGAQLVPACTSLLSAGGLVNFDFVNRDTLERKSKLGVEVHLACHLHNLNRLGSYDPQVKPHLHAWISFKENCKRFVLISSETQCVANVNGMNYGMQLDCNALVDGADTAIEWKIGRVYPHHGVQLAGYAAGLPHPKFTHPLARFHARKRIVVELRANGQPFVHRFEDKSDFDVFSSLLYVATWKQINGRPYEREKS